MNNHHNHIMASKSEGWRETAWQPLWGEPSLTRYRALGIKLPWFLRLVILFRFMRSAIVLVVAFETLSIIFSVPTLPYQSSGEEREDHSAMSFPPLMWYQLWLSFTQTSSKTLDNPDAIRFFKQIQLVDDDPYIGASHWASVARASEPSCSCEDTWRQTGEGEEARPPCMFMDVICERA